MIPTTTAASTSAAPTVPWLVGRFNQGVRRFHQSLLSRVELSIPQFTTLELLESHPGWSTAQLARWVFVTPQSMRDTVFALERRGLVERRPDPSDGRIMRARLTSAGTRIFRDIEPEHRELEVDLLSGIAELERQLLARGLTRMIDGLRPELPTRPGDASSPHAAAQVSGSVLCLVARVDQGIRRRLESFLPSHRLSVAEFTSLAVLERQPGLSNAQLARWAFITSQSMSEVVTTLEGRGLVERRADPFHARIMQTRLTAAGKRLLRRVEPDHRAFEADLVSRLSEAEIDVTVRGLVSMIRRLRHLTSEY